MQNFLKTVVILAIIGIVVIALLFVLDVVNIGEVKDTLQKTLLVLGVVALGGVIVGLIARSQ